MPTWMALVGCLVLLGCSWQANKPWPLQLQEEIAEENKEIEALLVDQMRRQSSSDPAVQTPKTIPPRPRAKIRMLSSTCTPVADRLPQYRLETCELGLTVGVRLIESSGAEQCDSLIQEILSETVWEPCGGDIACVFDFVVAFPSQIHVR